MGLALWWHGARPRTLGAAVVPVVVGTAAAGRATAWRTLGALTVALGLQVGVNYLNDYEDAVRGVDTPRRVGPVRLVASGLASGRAVRRAGLGAVGVAGVAGVLLARAAGWWLLTVGAAAVAGALLYAGGPHPYGARGLGEAAVFGFFGPAATCGTAYVQAGRVGARAWWSGIAVGLLAAGMLLANNLRDLPTDAAAGKRTLAVRLGEAGARACFAGVMVAGILVPALGVAAGALPPESLLALAGALPAALAVRCAVRARGAGLLPALGAAAAAHAAVGTGMAVGLWRG